MQSLLTGPVPMPPAYSSLVAGCAALAVAVVALGAPVAAQCTNPWPTVPGSTAVEGSVWDTLVFDPDGPGPVGERVLVAGSFQVAGTTMAQNLAVYDPGARTWAPFGPGPYPANLWLAQASNGDIYVGGNFSSIAGVSAANVARWNGASWSALGAGVNGSVARLITLPAGGIAVTGGFTSAGGVATAGIAGWNGTTWSSLGSTALTNPVFSAVVAMPNGDLCASVMHDASGSYFQGVKRFDGTSWSTVGSAFPAAPYALLALQNGELLAGGNSVPGPSPESVARWTGTVWAVLPGAPFQFVYELIALPNAVLVAAGWLPGSTGESRVATWEGSAWTTLGETPPYGNKPSLAALANGDLLFGGDFATVGGVVARSLARWNGVAWSAASPGLAGSMRQLAVRPDGSFFIGSGSGAVGESLVQRWNGVAWTPIGGGFASGSGYSNLTSLFALRGGDLLAGGQVGWGGTPPILQRWTAGAWTTLATASWGQILTAVEMANGDLVVGGQLTSLSGVAVTNIARFDGTNWAPIGAGVAGTVVALAVSPSGVLHAAAETALFRWNGTQWILVGPSPPSVVRALVFGNDGAPILGGNFAGPDVVRFDGSNWAPLGSGPGGPVQSLALLPDGDLVAGPQVDASNPARPLQRWNGSAWTPIGGAVDGTVWTLANALNGDLLLGGDFKIADGVPRCRFARVSTSCPATALSLPSGCFWSPIPVLAANVLPWLGGTCRTTGSNLPASSLAVIATGATGTAVPLSAVVPQATPGCQLLVVPDVLQLAVPVAGTVHAEFAVPDTVALLGAVVRQQVLPVVLGAGGAITAVQATNALVLQVGSF